jgi:hypothetical protein
MWPVMADLSMGAVRADAVFVSGLQRCDEPSAGQVRAGCYRGHQDVRLLGLCRAGGTGVWRSSRNSGDPDALGARRGPRGIRGSGVGARPRCECPGLADDHAASARSQPAASGAMT